MSRSYHERIRGMLGAVGAATGLIALFLISGRWTLSRMTEVDLGPLGEPRILGALLLLFIVLAPDLSDRSTPTVRRISARTLLLTFLFYGYMALSAAWAPEGANPMKLAELGMVIVCIGAMLRLTRATEPTQVATLVWRWLLPILLAFAALGALTGGVGGGRLAVLGGGPNVFGRNMGLLCVCMLGLVLQHRATGAAVGGAVVAGALVVLSGSRGALLATTAGVATVLYFNTGRIGRVVHVGLAVAIIAVGVVELTDFGAQVAEMFRHRVLRLGVEDRYDSGRSDVYLSAWELGRESPLFGIGLAGFEIVGNHVYPHNLFLEVFCEGGIVGLVLLLLVLGPAMVAIVRRRAGPAPRDYAAFVVALISAQFSGDLYDSRAVFVFGILVSVLARSADGRKIGPATRPRIRAHVVDLRRERDRLPLSGD
jgi:O-antigen ligase